MISEHKKVAAEVLPVKPQQPLFYAHLSLTLEGGNTVRVTRNR